MSQCQSVCQECELLDRYLAGRTGEVPCIVCDRLWCEAALKRCEHGRTLARSGWAMMNAGPRAPAAEVLGATAR